MRIALRHHRRLVSQQALHLIEFDASLDEPSREGMPGDRESENLGSSPSLRPPKGPPQVIALQRGLSLARKH